jgi:diguanylate cyclase (GGDEF)-like protein
LSNLSDTTFSIAERIAALTRGRSRGAKVRSLMSLGTAVGAVLVYVGVISRLGGSLNPDVLPWWSLVIGFFAAEVYALSTGRRSLDALSLHDAVLVFGCFFVVPAGLVAAQIGGALLAIVLFRRDRPYAAFARLATLALSSALGVLVFRALFAAAGGGEHAGWVAAFVGASVVATLDLVMTNVLAEDRRMATATSIRAAALAMAGSVSSASIALVAVTLVRGGELVSILLVVPFAGLAIALRSYASERRRLEQLRSLYDSMRTLGRTSGLDAGVSELLGTTRNLLEADVARIFLLPNQSSAGGRQAASTPTGETGLVSAGLSALEELAVTSTLRSGDGILLTPDDGPKSLRGLLSELGLREVLLTALRGDDDTVVGVLLAGDRREGCFNEGDLQLLDSFAGHAGVVLQNDRLEESLDELRTLKEQMHHQAYHDALTGLPNRRLFTEEVARALVEQPASHVAVLFLDLDDFKTVNDTLGHHAGDALLRWVAGRVRDSVRGNDVPARLGGDEFAVLAVGPDEQDALGIAERLVQSLEQSVAIDGREVAVHTSVGVAFGGRGATTADELLRNADVAMYGAKQAGKRRFAVYAPEMHRALRKRQALISSLEGAVERGEIGVHFQPIVDLQSRQLVCIEALARWNRPEHGLVNPSSFIPLADELGIMVDIGAAVLRDACGQLRSWEKAFPEHKDLVVSVNLAPSELLDPSLADSVDAVLTATGLRPERLVLEITESGVMSNPEQALETMRHLRERGVRLALDDFGTGHSSLAYLREFPLDVLKIARPFVAGLPDGHVDNVFIDAIVRLAASLGLDVIAEGIETPEQAATVESLGCSQGQGFYFGMPLSRLGVPQYLGAPRLPQGETRSRLERVA